MRKLDDIIPPSRRKETEHPLTSLSNKEPLRLTPRAPKFPFGIPIAIVLVIGVSIGALFYFSSAKVEVTPNTVSVAVKNPFTMTIGTGSQPFQVITAQKIASQSVKSSGTKTVSSFASGTITLYNTQSKAQKLITNTRFATAAGLIFRIHEPVTIPAGTAAKPGSTTAKVYADKVGDAYNIGATSFSIPGFAGTPQAAQVYARSNTAMTGGASGTVPVVDATIESQARSALMSALATDLSTSLEAQIPSGFILLPGAAATTYQELASEPSSTTGQVEVKEQGTITAVVFQNMSLAKAIAESVGGLGYQGEPVALTSAAGLTLAATEGIPEPDASSFSFSLSGTASIIYNVDPTRIAAAISGKTRSAAEVALSNYPEIKRAIIILRPFWRQTFPQDPSSISVVVVEPQR